MTMNITNIQARSILDSRGNPTVEVDLILENGSIGRAAVPSGASTGQREALELRDQNPSVYCGKSVYGAIENIRNVIAPTLLKKKDLDQTSLDHFMMELDGTENKSKLGANAILGVSMAYAKAFANATKRDLFETFSTQDHYSLPVPLMNVINGGAHASNGLDFQEFMIVPHGFDHFSKALQAGAEIFHQLKKQLSGMNLSTNVGDEGGFAPELQEVEQCLDLLLFSIEKAGYKTADQVSLALDVASSEFYANGRYQSKKSKAFDFDAQGMIKWYQKLCQTYPIVSIEDPLAENDWSGWADLTAALGKDVQLVGDDIFVTNPTIFSQGIEKHVANAILIKLNQIGTVTETLEAINMAKQADYGVIISHRSGETEDTFIADLSVGTASGQIKTGSLSRSDRVAKYNQLLRIEEKIPSCGLARGLFTAS
ncbi:MAG: phosphopyruvate hydratase [Bdellovibrionota bacterium]